MPGRSWGIALALLVSLPLVGAASEIRVTSASGAATSGGAPLEQHDTVAPGETIQVTQSGRASILGANMVVTLCNGAAMQFEATTDDGVQVLGIREGEIKASAGPREKGERLEIHTPVAIATLLGTAVHVAVDPVTGDSVITSLEHRVRVENIDASVEGYVILSPGDQVVVRRNHAPRDVSKVDPGEFGRSSSCLDDSDFRRAALLLDDKELRAATIAMIAAMDIPSSPDEVPSVASAQASIMNALSTGITGFNPFDDPGCPGRCDDLPDPTNTPSVPVVPPPLPLPP